MNRRIAGISAPALAGLLVLLVGGWFLLGALGAATVAVVVVGLYYAIAGASFNFLYGSLGVFSLAQSVFLAVGGYTGIYLNNTYGLSPWLSLLIAPIVAAIVALPIALAAVRAGTGAVLTALITLIISQAIPPILIAIKPLGGAVGLYADVKAEPGFWDMEYGSGTDFARVLLVLNVLVILFVLWWQGSRFGFYARAIRDSPNASAAVGIPNARMRIITYIIAAMIAAPAGVVYAQYNLLTTADLFLGGTALFQVIVVALAGGTARAWGSLVGSVVIVYLSKAISDAANGRPGIGPLTFALVFIVMALLMPRGLSGTWAQIVDRRRGGSGGSGGGGLERAPGLPAVVGGAGGPGTPGAPGTPGVAAFPDGLDDPRTRGETVPSTPEPRA
jgi:branched-chain amino acid transport system permease protein